MKYADYGYLVVPVSNYQTISSKLQLHDQWAASSNLKLNLAETSEIVFLPRRVKDPPFNIGIERHLRIFWVILSTIV